MFVKNTFEQRLEQGIVSAAKQYRGGQDALRARAAQGFLKVQAKNLFGDGVIGPALFNQGNQQGAGFLIGLQAMGGTGTGVGMALDGGLSGQHEHAGMAGRGGAGCGVSSGLNDPEDGDFGLGLQGIKGKGAGGIAGDNEQVGTVGFKKMGGADSVSGDGLAGFGAVGQAGGVAEVDVVSLRNEGKQRAHDGQATEAGVEDADDGAAH